jgi:glycosyltransferase involved in cell wall biosynthesis
MERVRPIVARDVSLGVSGAAHRRQLRKALRYLRALASALTTRAGVVYLVASDGPWAVADALVAAAARLRRRRLLVHHHAWSYLPEPTWPPSWVFRAGGAHATHVVLCRCMGDQLAATYGSRRVQVLSNAAFVPPGPEPGTQRSPTAQLRLLLLSNLTMDKGVGRAIALLETLVERGESVELTLAGPIVERGVDDAVASAVERGLPVRPIGYVDRAERDRLLEESDLLLFPSTYRNEAEPMVVLEALAAGLPVLAARLGCIEDLVGELGWVAPASGRFDGWAADRICNAGVRGRSADRARARERSRTLHTRGVSQLDDLLAAL